MAARMARTIGPVTATSANWKVARSGGLGLWAGTFEMPWDWRKAH